MTRRFAAALPTREAASDLPERRLFARPVLDRLAREDIDQETEEETHQETEEETQAETERRLHIRERSLYGTETTEKTIRQIRSS